MADDGPRQPEKPFPYYAWYPRDHDTPAYRSLSPLARLCVRELYDAMWQSGYSFPDNDAAVCRWVGIRLNDWRRIKPEILASCLIKISADRLVSDFVTDTHNALVTVRRTRQESAAQTNAKRAKSLETGNGQPYAKGNGHRVQTSDLIVQTSEQDKKKNPPNPPRGEWVADFQKFWDAYPKKEAKGYCKQVWQRKKPPLDAVLKALAWQRELPEWTKDNGQFVPQPSKYLNHRRWEDEPTAIIQPEDPLLEWNRTHAAD